jgi:imidazolonepropionase-like amidohydrolase
MTVMPIKLLKNASVLDVNNQKVLETRSILIEGKCIKKIGHPDELSAIEKTLLARSIYDLEKRVVLPGLIDAHVHLAVIQAAGVWETALENLRASETLLILHGAKNAAETLNSGITTVRDVGQGDILALKEAINRGVIAGPRIVACGWMGMTAGHQQCMNSEWRFSVAPRARDIGVDGPWEARKKVRELIGKGVDCIKTFAAGEGYRPHPFFQKWLERPNYTLEEMQALVDEAHMAGRRVAAHSLVSRRGTKTAIAAGVDTLEHGIFLDEADIHTMKDRGIFYVPTLAVVQEMWRSDEKNQYLQIDEERAAEYLDAHLESFARAHAMGVKIAMGSDTFRVLKHGNNAYELEWMVKGGMSPMEAIVSATKISAEALDIYHLVGSVETDKFADLLVVDPNPLEDISVLCDHTNIKMVMKDGEVIRFRD